MSTIGRCATPDSIAAFATAIGTTWMRRGIERHGDDVFAAEAQPRAAIGERDLVGHVLARQFGQSVRGGDLHLHVDGLGAHVERAAEDVGKAEDVVDLVGIIRAAGGDDHVVAHLLRVFRRDLGIGVGHGEDDRVGRHRS